MLFGGYLERIKDCHSITGGLSFNKPVFGGEKIVLQTQSKPAHNNIMLKNRDVPVLRDVRKRIVSEFAQDGRIPIVVSERISLLHARSLETTGVMDMWCKQEGSDEIVLPKELEVYTPVIEEAASFEKCCNPDYVNWNMWMLVDNRPVLKGHTQRNSGFHYDGLNLAGKYAGGANVSIYAWTNELPTLFYKKPVKFPENFRPNDNASILAQRQPKRECDILKFPKESLLKFDGCTVHSGDEAQEDLFNRTFIRICFTAPGMWFDRVGNTVNPFLNYPTEFQWRSVEDPSVRLRNTTEFETPIEFKNMWDVACLGHHAFATMYSGKKAHEFQLLEAIKLRGPEFLRNVLNLYNTKDDVQNLKAKMLEMKYYL